MGSHAGGGGRKLNGGFSAHILYGAAKRNELNQLSDNNFFHFAFDDNNYANLVKAENARRGNPVVVGNKGLEVGHYAYASETINGYKHTGDGVVTKFEGDKVWLKDKGGYPQLFSKSAVTRYAKDKNIGTKGFVFKIKNKGAINFTWGSK